MTIWGTPTKLPSDSMPSILPLTLTARTFLTVEPSDATVPVPRTRGGGALDGRRRRSALPPLSRSRGRDLAGELLDCAGRWRVPSRPSCLLRPRILGDHVASFRAHRRRRPVPQR